VGRLFDAVAALCGVRAEVNYEGQAAIELEAACDAVEDGTYPLGPDLDARELIGAVVADLKRGVEAGAIAARFHNALAAATAAALVEREVETVVLSGGVFANRRLLSRTRDLLERAGRRVLVPERLPPGDGGISYGQAAVAAAR
jgi:hydrogenase maturation protein HypF